jgi:hypothetical protein
VETFNGILIPCHTVRSAGSLQARLRSLTHEFLTDQAGVLFSHPEVRTYKLFKVLVANLTEYGVELLTHLWEIERNVFGGTARCTAFFLRSLYRLTHPRDVETPTPMDDKVLRLLARSPLENLAREFSDIWRRIVEMPRGDENSHEFLADHLLALADFLAPSPDCRVKVIINVGMLHRERAYMSECAVAQLTAAALIAEILACLEKLPEGGFTDSEHPAKCFVEACPSAASECTCSEAARRILAVTPGIRGFCDSKYFCECGLIYLIQMSIDTCRLAALFELCTKIHSLLRPLAENRRLWKVLGKHFQNGAMTWMVLAQASGKNDRNLGTYYRILFETGEVFIYRETKLANLWTVNEKMKVRAGVIAGGRTVKVENEGDNLDGSKSDPAIYRVHVKAVEPYFTAAERKNRVTAFEQNHNVTRFFYDLPVYEGGRSFEHCGLKRTIFTLPNPMPYLNSRVQIPSTGITEEKYSPISRACQELVRQVGRISEAAKLADYQGLQALLQGSLITQVNEGPKKMAEVFLTGANENEDTMQLRKIFRDYLDANALGVQVHQGYLKEHPIHQTLQDELEAGLNRLRSTLQPFLK